MINILIFILGLLIGSFLNVCIYRLPNDESLLFPWSHCPYCKARIKPYDNIPIMSYFLLHGRCRACNEKISWKYPFIELLTGVAFLIFKNSFGLSIDLVLNLILVSALIVITIIDFKYKTIPNKITLPLIVFFLAAAICKYILNKNFDFFLNPLIGLIAGGGILYLIAWISRGGMGGGDIKLAALIGIALGWEKTLLTLFLSFISGGIVGSILILTGKKNRKDMIPFGPFLCLGSIISILYGNEIINWYFGKF